MGKQPRQPGRKGNRRVGVELRQLSEGEQTRLDELMSANSQGLLSNTETAELTQLVLLAHRLALENARLLTDRT